VKRLQERAERLARVATERAKAKIVRTLEVPGVEATRTEQGVVLAGRGLLRRVVTDERLRWIGGLLR
jgi:hypothetical protein